MYQLPDIFKFSNPFSPPLIGPGVTINGVALVLQTFRGSQLIPGGGLMHYVITMSETKHTIRKCFLFQSFQNYFIRLVSHSGNKTLELSDHSFLKKIKFVHLLKLIQFFANIW